MKFDHRLGDADDLKEVIKRYKGIYRKALNEEIPQDPKRTSYLKQSKRSIPSLGITRAIYYRPDERHSRRLRNSR